MITSSSCLLRVYYWVRILLAILKWWQLLKNLRLIKRHWVKNIWMNMWGGCKCPERERKFKNRLGSRSLDPASSGKINLLSQSLLVLLPFNLYCLKMNQICLLQTESLTLTPYTLQHLLPAKPLKLNPLNDHSPLHSVPLFQNVVATVLAIAHRKDMLTTLKPFRLIKL